MIALWLALSAAPAHPLSKDTWSLRTAVRVRGDAVEALAVLEVPFDVVGAAVRQARAADPDTPASVHLEAVSAGYLLELAAQARVEVDGVAVPGAWVAKDHPMNGRGSASEGFFTYLVTFAPAGAWPLDDDVTVRIAHTGFADAPMVYSVFAVGEAGWTVRAHSAQGILPDGPYRIDEPAFWSDDARLRAFEGRFTRGG